MTKDDLMRIDRTKDFIHAIEKLGYEESRKIGGSHRIFKKSGSPTLSIPDGGQKNITTGTKRNLVKLILGEVYYK